MLMAMLAVAAVRRDALRTSSNKDNSNSSTARPGPSNLAAGAVKCSILIGILDRQVARQHSSFACDRCGAPTVRLRKPQGRRAITSVVRPIIWIWKNHAASGSAVRHHALALITRRRNRFSQKILERPACQILNRAGHAEVVLMTKLSRILCESGLPRVPVGKETEVCSESQAFVTGDPSWPVKCC